MPAKIDLTNQRFGRLFVIKDSGQRNISGNILWKCQCDCGKICLVNGSYLKNGHTSSCGCYGKKEAPKKNIKNLIGQKFGKLTVLKDSGKRQNRSVLWLCQCDCGNYTYVRGVDLKNKHTLSCGKCLFSKGEFSIQQLLEQNNIRYIPQKTFEDCYNPLTKIKFRFDFYLPDYNTCIEYDGEQHFKEVSIFKDDLETIQYRDNLKNQYCKEHNIDLIRIPYYNINNITIQDLIKE